MKKYLFFALAGALALATGCKKDETITDDTLVQEIAYSTQKIAIPTSELPASTLKYIDENHFETYIETAYLVPERGYEAILGNEELVFCDRNGRVLHPKRPHFRRGPCGHGEAVDIDSLPANIVEYIETNYPNAEIIRAKQLENGRYIIKINEPHYILIFEEDGTFVEAVHMFHHCHSMGQLISIDNLPEVITTYVEENYPGSEILVAFQKVNGMYILGVSTAEGRKIMVFDANGNLLFVRP